MILCCYFCWRISTNARLPVVVSPRELVSKEGDSTEISRLFYNKQLIVVVTGQVVDNRARKQLQEKVQADGWQVWLPDGSGLALGDACFEDCREGFEGPPISQEGPPMRGRNSPSSAPAAMPPIQARPSFVHANRQTFRLPGCTQRLPSCPSRGGCTLKLGWR